MPGWTPQDLVVGQRFCPVGDIAKELQTLRRDIDVEWLALLAIDSAAWLQSLSFFSGPHEMAAAFAKSSRHVRWDPKLPAPRASDRQIREFADRLLATPLRPRVATSVTHHARGVDSTVRGARVGFWIVAPSVRARLKITRATLDRIQEMLSGTVEARAHRDASRERTAFRNLEHEYDYLAQVSDILNGLLDDSEAFGAAYYQAASDANELDLVDFASADGLWEGAFDARIPLDAASDRLVTPVSAHEALASSYRRTSHLIFRTHIHMKAPERGSDTKLGISHTATQKLAAGRQAMGKIGAAVRLSRPASFWEYHAIPVFSPSVDGTHQHHGVLAVVKRGRNADAAALSAMDVDLFENAAPRLARAQRLNRRREADRRLIRYCALLSDNLPNATISLTALGADEDPLVPSDLADIRSALSTLLEDAIEFTGARSGHIRSLVTKNENGTPSTALRTVVARAGAGPEAHQDDAPVALLSPRGTRELSLQSADAHAATLGRADRPTELRDIRRNLGVQARGLVAAGTARPDTRAQVAVPIFAAGLVVGTFELESPHGSHFANQVDAVAGFAALAGVAVAIWRRETVRAIAERFSLVKRGHHDAFALREVAAKAVKHLPAELALQLSSIVSQIVDATREQAPPVEIDSTPVGDLVARIFDKFRTDGRIILHGDQTATTKSSFEPAITAALREILKNTRGGTTDIVVSLATTRLGSVDFTAMSVSIPDLRFPHGSATLSRLYHGPLPDTKKRERPHLGCYTAGEAIRGIGGNVLASTGPAGELVSTLLFPNTLGGQS